MKISNAIEMYILY